MQSIVQVPMENVEVLGARAGLFANMSKVSSDVIRRSGNFGSDLVSLEDFILEDMDSFLDEFSARLTVSRMVSESIIRGTVNAIEKEAAEKIALKETEVTTLKHKLKFYECSAAKSNKLEASIMNIESQKTEPDVHQCPSDARQEFSSVKILDSSKIAAEEELPRFPQGKAMAEEHWGEGIQREVSSVMVQNIIETFEDEFEKKFSEQRSYVNTIYKNWQKRLVELSTMRQELDAINRSVCSSELGLQFSHNSLEGLEEWSNGRRKETGYNNIVMEKSEEFVKPTPTDFPQLKHMSKDELIAHFKSELNKMKRQQDLVLQEKTEELFSLKRELLKEKGSSPLHFRKEKEFELIRKKFPEFISKLDDILLENEKLPIIYEDQNILYSLKKRINSFFRENQWLQGLLGEKKMRVTCYASPVSLAETKYMKQIKELEANIEDVKMEVIIREETLKIVLKDLVGELEANIEDVKMEVIIREETLKIVLKDLVGELEGAMQGLDMAAKVLEDNYSFIYNKIMEDAFSSINFIITECFKEKECIKAVLLDKEKSLIVEVEENKRLKQERASALTSIEEKEKLASEAASALVKQKEHFDMVCHELNLLRDEACNKEKNISECRRESDLMKDRLDECLQQFHQHEAEISNLNQKFKVVSDTLVEAESQKNILHSSIQEKQEKLVAAITKDKEQKKQLESIIVSVTELSKAIGNSEHQLAENMEINKSRLKILSHQCSQLLQEAHLFKRKGLWFKQRLERKCSDLQKAENEVDLLGDEVDALLGLLEKIYMALDHYSPVLQHYPGVMEILRIIRRELKGENTNIA